MLRNLSPAQRFISRPVTNEAILKDYEDRHNGLDHSLPCFIQNIKNQQDRKSPLVNGDFTSRLRGFDTYQIARELEHDLLAKSDRHAIRQDLADYIEGSANEHLGRYAKRVLQLRAARTSGAVGITVNGSHITAWDDKVNCVRLCPDESREDCQRISRKYSPEIYRLLKANPSWRAFFVVYTEPNAVLGSLNSAKRDQYKRFANMHRSKWFKSRVQGSFVIQEDPLSQHFDWNIHLNAIHIVDGDFNYGELRKQWGYNVDIQRISGSPEAIAKAFLEAVKYAAKHVGEKSLDGKHIVAPGITSWPFDAFDEWFQAGHGFRRSRSYGCLFRIEGSPDKGADLSTVSWIGVTNHDGTGYQVHLKREFELSLSVDLIQADNSTDSQVFTPRARGDRSAQPPI